MIAGNGRNPSDAEAWIVFLPEPQGRAGLLLGGALVAVLTGRRRTPGAA